MSSLRLVVVFILLYYGSSVTAAREKCEVKNTTALCKEDFVLQDDDSITKIIIRSQEVREILENEFEIYPHLEELDVSYSGLIYIDEDAFLPNKNLKILTLAGNPDHEINEDRPLISSESIKFLNISHNAFKALPESTFNDLPNLEEIDLSYTPIKKLPSLTNLKNLKTLIISEDSNLNTSSLCHETKLKQIIQISNNIKTKINCTNETKEDTLAETEKNTTIPSVSHFEKEENHDKNETTTAKFETEKSETENPKTETVDYEQTNTTENLQTTEKETNISESKTPKNVTNTPNMEIPIEQNEDTTIYEKLGNATEAENPTTLKSITEISEKFAEDTNTEEKKLDSSKIEAESIENTNLTTETDESTTENRETDENKLANLENAPNNIKTVEDKDTNVGVEAVKPQESNESGGTNIVLGIILSIMIVGAVGFGYKYWKNRRSGYRNANTEDIEEGKELQNIATHRAEPEQN